MHKIEPADEEHGHGNREEQIDPEHLKRDNPASTQDSD
jgi:hypothetical protein